MSERKWMTKKRAILTPGAGWKIEKKSRWEPREEFKKRVAVSTRARMNARTGGLLGVELKYVDQVKAETALTATWAGAEIDPAGGDDCIGACVQGSSATTRDGTRIVVKSIHIQGYIRRGQLPDAADVRSPVMAQLSLVMDKQSNGVQLSAEDVYGVTDPEVPGRRVLENSSRFKVLKTEMFCLHDTAAGTDGANTMSVTGNIIPFDWFIKLNQVVNFVSGAGAGTIADFKDVSFHMIGAANIATGGDYVTYNSRVRFVG